MKLNTSFPRWAFFAGMALVLFLALVAWKGNPQQHSLTPVKTQDTVPDKNRNRDLDKELRQLDEADQQLEKLKAKDWEKIQRDVEGSIQKIDFDKLHKETKEAMEKINFDKVHRQLEESLSRMDFDKIQQQIDESMASIDKEEIKAQLKKAQKQVQDALEQQNWKESFEKAQSIQKEQLDKQMQKLQSDMEKLKADLKHQQFNFKEQMDKANIELDKAREEMKGYQEMIYDMEKDKLLSTDEDYSIEYKDGDLFINDKKQSPEITNRYKKYFRKDKLTIKKEGGNMHIQHQSDKHLD